jgi:hypothetical protein
MVKSGQLMQRPRIVHNYGQLPLAFERNQGQTDKNVNFLSRGSGYSLFLSPVEAVFALRESAREQPRGTRPKANLPRKTAVLRIKLIGANPGPAISGEDELSARSNYFIGNDPTKWHREIPQFSRVHYANIYPFTDLIYYGNQRQLEYDFSLRPGADPTRIRLRIDGTSEVRLDQGDLVLVCSTGEIRLHRPHVYQLEASERKEIRGDYVLKRKNEVGFRIAPYDLSKTLVIDPVVAYSALLGGSGNDIPMHIAVDASGNAYVTGYTSSLDFPVARPIQAANHGGPDGLDAFVTKISAAGDGLVYSTYLGGTGDDSGQSITVDTTGNAYLTGYTRSYNFPIKNAIQTTRRGDTEAFVTKINADGSDLVYSTYLGGSGEDYGWGIAVDSLGNTLVRGDTWSRDFPIVHAIQPTYGGGNFNCFLTKLSADGSAFVYSTYWGGSGGEGGIGLAVDAAGNAYLAGYTVSDDFPTVNPIQSRHVGSGFDAFISKFSADGQTVFYSTYLGGSQPEWQYGIAVDPVGNAYISGYTESVDFPVVNALQATNHGGIDAFVAKVNAKGSALVYSTYLGGITDDTASSIAVDSSGNAYVGGYTKSTDFPVVSAIQAVNHGGIDAFVTRINSDGSALLYSTYLGGSADESTPMPWNSYRDLGIAVDSAGSAYLTGSTWSSDFPTTPGAFQSSLKGVDAFVAKIMLEELKNTTTTLNSAVSASVFGQAISFTADVSSDSGTPEGTVQILSGSSVAGTGTLVNGSAVISVSTLQAGADSVTASYLGTSDFAPSKSAPHPQNVMKASTTTSLTTSLNPAATSQPVTLRAIVKGAYDGATTGNIAFMAGSESLGSGPVTGNVATLTTSFASSGTYSITALYRGDSNNTGSTSGALSEKIIASTTTRVTSSLNPSMVGQTLTFSATVNSSGGAPPNGENITFYNGMSVMGTAPLSAGTATLTTSALPAGVFTITARYPGDSNFAASTSVGLRQTVNSTTKSPTAITLASSLNPSIYGQKVTFTAGVTTSGPVPPTGTVAFRWTLFARTYTVGYATLNSSGIATFTRSNLNADPYPLTAVYRGDANNLASTSAVVNQTVTQTASSATITSSLNPSTQGQSVTFTAKITSPTVLPTGPVTFRAGTTVLGTAQLSGGKATLTVSSLAVGSIRVTVTYYGDSNIARSSASVTQIVQ